ncbi:MAG: hypothetical protein ACFFCD_02550 [Promethearchaeota archaeon]
MGYDSAFKGRYSLKNIYRDWLKWVLKSFIEILGYTERSIGLLHTSGRHAAHALFKDYFLENKFEETEVVLPPPYFEDALKIIQRFLTTIITPLSSKISITPTSENTAILDLKDSVFIYEVKNSRIPLCSFISGFIEASLERMLNYYKEKRKKEYFAYVIERKCKGMNHPSCIFEIKIREQSLDSSKALTTDIIEDPTQTSKLSGIQSSVVSWIKKRIRFDEVHQNWIIYVWNPILRIMGLNEITQGILHATGRRAGQQAYLAYIDRSDIKLPDTFPNMMYLLKVFVQEVLVGLPEDDVEIQLLSDDKAFLILQESPYTLGFPQGTFIPVCDVIAGELEASLERIINKVHYNGASKVYVREVQCKTLGDPVCKFEVMLIE